MKNYGRMLGTSAAIVMLMSAFASCSNDKVLTDSWEIDKDNHWHLTENGNTADTAAHTLEEYVCTVCGAEIMEFNDEVWVTKNNDNGDTCLSITYDANGNVIENMKYEYTYDEDGNWASQKVYDDGRLYRDYVYASFEDESGSGTYAQTITIYNEDGTKLIEEYDQNGWSTKEARYLKDGTLDYEYAVVNEFNDMDLIASVKKYDGETLVSEVVTEYDSDGNKTAEKAYFGDTLIKESLYTNMDGYIYVSKEIVYNEDGSQTVTEYDEYGEVIG
ncbi:MAG: hypothetical protein IJX77_00700 [Ruminococcus sp.]|nr:hypothetical protein [Ruminococcus sp.]